MSDCNPTSPCKSKRCAQAGVCNCLLKYSDGTDVRGSGTGDDPYIIDKPKIASVRDAQGNILVPDSTRTITLPPTINRVISAETGQEYIPDNQGRVTIPTVAISSLVFKDLTGNLMPVETNDIITFQIDGGDGTFHGYNSTTVDPIAKTVTFPSLKTYQASAANIAVAVPGSIGATDTPTTIVDITGPGGNFSQSSAGTSPLHIAMQIWHGGNPFDAGAANDYFKFNVVLQDLPGTSESVIASNVVWTGDKAQSYHSYLFNTLIPHGNSGDYRLRIRIIENQLPVYRNTFIRCDAQMIGQWI